MSEPQDLWPHQKDAIAACLDALGRSDRVQIHMACGTGKTRTAGQVMNAVAGETTVWLCPTVELLLQSYHRTLSDLRSHSRLLVAYSRKGILEDGTPITNDIKAIVESIDEKALVFCTYASFPYLDTALSQIGRPIDLIIADEAHKTVGEKQALYARWLQPETKIMRRLAMTATPRFVTANAGRIEYVSMNDETIFGSVAFHYSFDQAKREGVICNVEALVPIVSGAPQSHEARHEALLLARKRYGLARIVTFHGTVKDARSFSNFLNKHGVEAVHVNGRTPRAEIERVRRRLDDQRPIVVTNARLFGEGIDVPALDAVFFCDFKSSMVDVTQQVGRVVRLRPGKSQGYVILPASNRPDLENVFRRGRFGLLWGLISGVLDATDSASARRFPASTVRPQIIGGTEMDAQVFEAGFEKLLVLRRIEIGRQSWFAKALAVLEWLEGGNLPYQSDSPHKEWISENTRALKAGRLSEDQAEIMQRVCHYTEGREAQKYQLVCDYLDALENGARPKNELSVLLRNNRKKPKFAPLYARLVALRNSEEVQRRARRLAFIENYEKGVVEDKGMYAQFVKGTSDEALNARFKRLHKERMTRLSESREQRQREAVRRLRDGESAKELASEYRVDLSTIWQWYRTVNISERIPE
jgi:superfamily II DNA or RNA helicase